MVNNKNTQQHTPETPTVTQNTVEQAKTWSNINDQLSAALKTWADISAQSSFRQAPDEVQQQEVERLLKQLQKQIAEFK